MPRILLACAIMLALLVSGCKINGSKANASQGNIRIVQLNPGVGAIDLATADATVSTNVSPTVCPGTPPACDIAGIAFQSKSSYKSYNSGTATFFAILADNGTGVLANNTFTLNANTNYSYILFGSAGNAGSMLLSDSVINTPASGTFVLRPVHVAAGSAGLDFYLLPSTTTSITNSTANFGGFTLSGISAFQQFNAGSYTMYIAATGTKNILFQSAPMTFSNGDIVSAVIYSSGSGSLVNLELMYQDNSAGGATTHDTVTLVPNINSQFKTVNAAPSIASLNVLLDGAPSPTFSSIPFGSISSYATITPVASQNVNFYLGSTLLATVQESLLQGLGTPAQGGTDYSLVLVDQPVRHVVTLTDNNLPPPSNNTNIRFVNAVNIPGSTIDVQASFKNIVTALPPNSASPYINFTKSALPPTITGNVSGNTGAVPQLTGLDLVLVTGGVYTIYFIGNPGTLQAVLTRDQ